MAFLVTWNAAADKMFESGLDRGVLFVQSAGAYPLGVAWEGLINVTEKPSGAEITDLWANNAKYSQLVSVETFDCSIEAYTFPNAFLACLGMEKDTTDPGVIFSQQQRVPFGLAWRSYLGSDADGQQANYKIHIAYGLIAQPAEVAHATINDSPEAATFSFEAKSTPAIYAGGSPVSKITLDESVLTPTNLAAIEDALYGTDPTPVAYLPLPDALVALLV
jgi:hypothetical protein